MTRKAEHPQDTPQNDETRAEAFRRLARDRTRRAVKSIELVGNLSARSSYEFDPEQVEKVFAKLQETIDDARNRFRFKADQENLFDL